jgi:hypothetical protein
MSGALVNLVAKGAQDAFLTGKPEVSFFQSMYKRHTNFAQFPVELFPIGTAGTNSTISLPIARKGDLLTYIWAEMSSGTASTAFGSESATPALFRLYVGGQMIEEHDAFYANSLYTKFLTNTGAKGFAGRNAAASEDNTWLPLHFSCCDEAGCALPLVALQYHDVEVRVQFGSTGDGDSTKYYANYIQLDTDERAAMANAPREMLITQVQRIQPETVTAAPKVDLSYFNHPVKCLLWGASNVNSDQYTFDNAKLNLNGVDVFDPMTSKYFAYVQPYHHSSNSSEMQAKSNEADYLWMYSFALKADKYQPCGTCNFSRLDNAEIKFGNPASDKNLNWFYGVNYNIFRIQNGMGGVAFAN